MNQSAIVLELENCFVVVTCEGLLFTGVSLRFGAGGHLDLAPGKFMQNLKNIKNL